jgi:hypothetical protein
MKQFFFLYKELSGKDGWMFFFVHDHIMFVV